MEEVTKKKENPKVKEVKKVIHKVKDGVKNILCAQTVSAALLASGIVLLAKGIIEQNTPYICVGATLSALSIAGIYISSKTINTGVDNAITEAEKLIA